ncbi:unnamed protein product [Arctogadus glacialis]
MKDSFCGHPQKECGPNPPPALTFPSLTSPKMLLPWNRVPGQPIIWFCLANGQPHTPKATGNSWGEFWGPYPAVMPVVLGSGSRLD